MSDYQLLTAGIVKSIRQRWILSHWAHLCAGRSMPVWSDLDMGDLDACFDDMSFLELIANGAMPKLRIVAHGKNVGAMYAGQCAGKLLEETLPAATRAGILQTYGEAIARRRPVYTVSCAGNPAGRHVYYERLLLPFGTDRVTHIAAFLETISHEGQFERAGLLADSTVASHYQLKAVLETDGLAAGRSVARPALR